MARPFVVLFGVMALWMSGVQATPLSYTAVFGGANEVPPNPSSGTGTASVTYDPLAHTLLVDVVFSGLTGTTSAAHIHCCAPPGVNVGIANAFADFPLGVMAGSYMRLLDLSLSSSFNPTFVTNNGGTVASAESTLAAGLAGGLAYFNIHTNSSPGGEIRANLAAVPEPATGFLVGLGATALLASRRKQRADTEK